MATITTRAGKGSPLTNNEVDANFTNLNDDKQEVLAEGAFVDGDKSKLDGIEASATADQTAGEIKTAYESNADTNAFTDAEQSKLSGIEASADVTDTANVTAAGALMDSEVANLAQVKSFDSADYATAAQGDLADSALQNVADDTTPQLGGNLDTNGNDITFGDNDKAIFGAGGDLEIYHDGSNSRIKDVGTGNLNIQAESIIRLQDASSTDNYIKCVKDGSVDLYYSGASKLATTNTGIDVTGTVTADGLTVDGTADVDNLIIDNAGKISSVGQIELQVDTDNNQSGTYIGFSRNNTTSERLALFSENGDISFYEDTGATAKFFWDASAERLGIGTTSPSDVLELTADGVDFGLLINNPTNNPSRITLTNSEGSSIIDANNNLLRFNQSGSADAVIDSSGNVGIGTTSPVNVSGVPDFTVAGKFFTSDGTPTNPAHSFTGDQDTGMHRPAANTLAFATGGSERMRIDSSGRLLINKTSFDATTVGCALTHTGLGAFVRDGAEVGIFNRLTSDGNIIEFRKDGSEVGSIGTDGGNLYIEGVASSKTGLEFRGSAVYPRDAGSLSDGTTHLGGASNRWNDLYLSGGVYLGGTGSANKLDDYEEGTWTPTYGDGADNTYSGSYDFNEGRYTKIGRVVFFSFRIRATDNMTSSGLTGSQEIRINGLPFTKTSDRPQAIGFAELYADRPAGASQNSFFIRESVDYVALRGTGDDFNAENLTVTMINDGPFRQVTINGFFEI